MKTAQEVSNKFVQRASAASGDYVEGARSTEKNWQQATAAAAEVHKAATMEALNRGAFAKGVQAAGNAAWQQGIETKGSTRYAEGVSTSASKYAENSARFDAARQAAKGMPRQVKGSPANLQRTAAVVAALRKVKTGA